MKIGFNVGDVVISTAGRDKGTFLVVVEVRDNQSVFVADGNIRKIENPKLKKNKHISKINVHSSIIYDKIKCNEKIPNILLRKELESINDKN